MNVHSVHTHVCALSLFYCDKGVGAAIYFGWPGATVQWQLLGFLTNEKPSAIFKISSTRPVVAEGGGAMDTASPFGTVAGAGADVGQIGISVESLARLKAHTPHASAAALTASDLTTFTQKMLESLHQFVRCAFLFKGGGGMACIIVTVDSCGRSDES